MAWSYNRYDDADNPQATESQLVFAAPETDDVQVIGACSAAEEGGAPRMILSGDVARLQANAPVQVRFTAPGLDRIFNGVVVRDAGGESPEGAGLVIPVNDLLWQALPRLVSINYSIGGQSRIPLPLAGVASPAGSFLRDCVSFSGQAPVAAQATPGTSAQTGAGSGAGSPLVATDLFADDDPGVGAGATAATSADTCKTLSKSRSTDGGKSVRVTFVNRTNELRTVNEIQADGTPVEYAQLEGGQSFKANTLTTHLWMMTDGPGNCIEMMLPSPAQAVFEIKRPSPGFGNEGD
jgi:hypothetical protein